MSEPPNAPPEGGPSPGEGDAPYLAKRRLPFGETPPGRSPGLIAAAILYGVAMLIGFGVAGYMAGVQRHPFVSVPVLASIAIGIWFFIRMLMVLRPPRPRE